MALHAYLLVLLVIGLMSPAIFKVDATPSVPPDWERRSEAANMFINTDPETEGALPQLGNGYMSGVPDSPLFAAGVFNGPHTDNTHRAEIAHTELYSQPGNASRLTLCQYYSQDRSDSTLCADTDYSVCPSFGGDYNFYRFEGLCASSQETGTIPLYFFWNSVTSDNAVSINDTLGPLFNKVRIACYVWKSSSIALLQSSSPPGAVALDPLKLYYSDKRHDHLAVSTPEGQKYAEDNGYQFLGNQGYVQRAVVQDNGRVRALDVERAAFYQMTVFPSGASMLRRDYAHYTRPNVLVREMFFSNPTEHDQSFDMLNVSMLPSPDIDFSPIAREPSLAGEAISYFGTVKQAATSDSPKANISVICGTVPSTVTVHAGTNVTVRAIVVVSTSLNSTDANDPMADARAHYANAMSASPEALFQEHTQAWLDRYANARIVIDGDLDLARAVNSSMFQILTSARPDYPMGLSPGGLGNSGYNGHSFWDMDTWMYPAVLPFHTELASSLIRYRLNRVPAARQNAAINGYAGTQFPWESAFTGLEAQQSHGKIGPWGMYEHHITGDVAYSVQQYYYLSRNDTWLREHYPLVRGAADFWASCAVANADGSYSINQIMPPDEFHYPVNDSVYTNRVAQISLAFGVEAAAIVGEKPPSNWSTIAKNLRFPLNSTGGYHPEFQGYAGDNVKQADVILLGFPLLTPMDQQVRRNDLAYYENHTVSDGPAMTWAMFAVGWMDLGDNDKVDELFKRGYANIAGDYRIWHETPSGGCPNFITGAGGFLQSVIYGYGGVRITHDGLNISAPSLSSSISSIRLDAVRVLGWTVRIAVTNETVDVVPIAAGDRPLELVIEHAGQPATTKPLAVGDAISNPRASTRLLIRLKSSKSS